MRREREEVLGGGKRELIPGCTRDSRSKRCKGRDKVIKGVFHPIPRGRVAMFLVGSVPESCPSNWGILWSNYEGF